MLEHLPRVEKAFGVSIPDGFRELWMLSDGMSGDGIDLLSLSAVEDYADVFAVKIELDLGWLAYAKVDPVQYIKKYSGRVISCHLKDFDAKIASDVPQRKLVPPGAGAIDFAAALAAMRAAKVAHGFIEIDVSDDALAGVRRGHEHLQHLQGCA